MNNAVKSLDRLFRLMVVAVAISVGTFFAIGSGLVSQFFAPSKLIEVQLSAIMVAGVLGGVWLLIHPARKSRREPLIAGTMSYVAIAFIVPLGTIGNIVPAGMTPVFVFLLPVIAAIPMSQHLGFFGRHFPMLMMFFFAPAAASWLVISGWVVGIAASIAYPMRQFEGVAIDVIVLSIGLAVSYFVAEHIANACPRQTEEVAKYV